MDTIEFSTLVKLIARYLNRSNTFFFEADTAGKKVKIIPIILGISTATNMLFQVMIMGMPNDRPNIKLAALTNTTEIMDAVIVISNPSAMNWFLISFRFDQKARRRPISFFRSAIEEYVEPMMPNPATISDIPATPAIKSVAKEVFLFN